ncbi:DUF2550 domain-containing protein [Gordonia sp. L191]|uniref:DUF2550 domain-containing protein n=1 Tax=Gordonia TaxID=2053 RepID=UPI001AD6168E|nr:MULTISPECIES: DUF2550 domain-containing protein [Gordonia]QTI71346.1 DUF2550 domain-containing protein [Gordonia polyisoprenivorans]WHU45252.1 DUF2550 domain-containing protein [Gordonia sp. L191]
MSELVITLSVLLLVALCVCGLLAYRVAQLRRGGTPVLLRTLPADVDEGWRHGTVHYSDEALRYFRLSSLRPGPSHTLPRSSIEIAGRRRAVGSERDILEGLIILHVHQSVGTGVGKDYEIAFDAGGVTAFQSWLESRRSARAERRSA